MPNCRNLIVPLNNMDIFEHINAPIEELSDEITRKHNVSLFIKREDLNHPEIMGNKLRKLKYNILEAQKLKSPCILSFGGAYSNHILALSAAGRIYNIPTIGIIRGNELASKPLNPVLTKANENGMQLHFVTREEYKIKNSGHSIKKSHERFGDFYMLPEGGSNALAVKGSAEILDDLKNEYNVITCACGTGGTLAGIVLGAYQQHFSKTKILGFQVLNADDYIEKQVKSLLNNKVQNLINWSINTDYHFDGYAKKNSTLIQFMNWFKLTHNIDLDYIYTGKMMFGLYQLIQSSYFNQGDRLLAIHTGGTQTAKVLPQ